MAKRPLVSTDIERAKQLIDALDEADFPVTTAFWQYEDDAEMWFLYLASRLVGTRDQTELYGLVDDVRECADIQIPLSRIKLVSPKRQEIKAVTDRVRESDVKWGPVWHSSSATVSNISSEDLLVYRSS